MTGDPPRFWAELHFLCCSFDFLDVDHVLVCVQRSGDHDALAFKLFGFLLIVQNVRRVRGRVFLEVESSNTYFPLLMEILPEKVFTSSCFMFGV